MKVSKALKTIQSEVANPRSSGLPPADLACVPMPGAGLCDSCNFQRVVHNTRGSQFSLCRRSVEDPRYPRYPRVPVLACPGWERRQPREGGGD